MNKRPIKSRCLKLVGTAACMLAVLGMLGGHWMVLQSFAWARMLAQYAQEGSLTSAIVKTFNGQHPCDLCLSIQHDRQQEQRANKNLQWIKQGEPPDLFCDLRPTPVPLPSDAGCELIPFVPQGHPDFIDNPPKPPPRQPAAAL